MMFQFLNGSIKAEYIVKIGKALFAFQFLNGSIKASLT